MSFYPQPNDYQCGPFALKYALIMYGIFKNENQIGIAAGSSWWAGTDEIGLARAAKKYKCTLYYFNNKHRKKAFDLLNKKLVNNNPCILSVHNWEHWITVISYSQGMYVTIDSGRKNVIDIVIPKNLDQIWRYQNINENFTSYDGYSLTSKSNKTTYAKFSLGKARELIKDRNNNLSRKWDTYFTDVTNFCCPRNELNDFITFKEFLRRHKKQIIRNVADWHGDPTYHELSQILTNMNFIAEVYDLVIPVKKEKKAIMDLISLLMMHVCGKYGMHPLY